MKFCQDDFDAATGQWKCSECGAVIAEPAVRECPFVPRETIHSQEREHWATCPHRGAVIATIDGQVAGCGCPSSPTEVYQCSRFNEPVIKHGKPPSLEKLRKKVPVATGRTCRECKVPTEPPPESPGAVAVVVTCHNYGRYLRQCLDSILAQTVKPETIVLVDDASDDDTGTIGQEYTRRGVKHLRADFRDVARARNHGAGICGKPEFLLYVDADDVLPTNYIETLRNGMDSRQVGVAYGQLDRWDGEKSLGKMRTRDYDLAALRRGNYINACSLVRRKAIEQVGGWQSYQHGLQDWDLWLRIGESGWQMKCCGTALLYRVHGDSMTDKRRAILIPQMRVIRRAQTTAIVTLFSGRGWHLDKYFAAIKTLDWEKKNLHVVAVDNSADAEFSKRLLSHLADGPTPFSYVRERQQIVQGMAADKLADDAKARIANTYAIGQHLARLYSLATKALPAVAARVWSIEDDVEVMPDALVKLTLALLELKAGAVTGTMRSRFSNHLLVRRRRDRPSQVPAAPVTVTEHGFYCLLTYRDVWDSIAWRPGDNDRSPYYDWAGAHDIWQHNPTYMVPSVRCRHWQADGSVVDA